MDRMEPCTAAPSPQSGYQQQPLPYPAGALSAQLGQQGLGFDSAASFGRLAGLLRPSGLGGQDLCRSGTVLRHGVLGQRLDRTWPDRWLGPTAARLLRQTRPTQTALLPSTVQKCLSQSAGRISQTSPCGGRTKDNASLHLHGEANPLDG